MRQHPRAGQPRLDRGAVAQDPVGHRRDRLEVPVPGRLAAAEDDLPAVREQVGEPGGLAAGSDEEFGQARVGGHDSLAPDRGHRRVARELAGVRPGAVHDHPRPGLVRRAGQGGHRGRADPAARAPEPGLQVAEIGRHVNQRRGVPPAAAESRRQLVRLARAVAAELGEPVRRGGRAAEDLGPAPRSGHRRPRWPGPPRARGTPPGWRRTTGRRAHPSPPGAGPRARRPRPRWCPAAAGRRGSPRRGRPRPGRPRWSGRRRQRPRPAHRGR